MARQAQITVERDEGTLVIEFAHGKRIEVRPSQLVASVQEQAMFHGLKQKLVDAAAIRQSAKSA